MSTATLLFLTIGALGIIIAAVALLGGDVLDLGDGFVSTEVLAAVIGGFGFGAAVASELLGTSARMAAVLVVGVLTAALASCTAWLAVSRLRRLRTDATPTRTELMGSNGVVVTPIPVGGYGEVRVRIGGQPVKLDARSARPLALGEKVVVIEAPTETSVIVRNQTFS